MLHQYRLDLYTELSLFPSMDGFDGGQNKKAISLNFCLLGYINLVCFCTVHRRDDPKKD